MSTEFLLSCFVLGDDEERVFPIKAPRNDNVGILKDEIKKKKARLLNDVDASDLDLWKVCLPLDDPASKQPQTGPPLRVNKRLSSLWDGDPSDDDLHILVKAPVDSTPMPTLTLNCLFYDDIHDYRAKGFPIEIGTNKTVGSLRDAIKEKAMLSLPANSLMLFKVSLPVNDALDTELLSLDLANCGRLEPFSTKLSSFFDYAPEDHLHILVKQPLVTEPTSRRSLYTIEEEARLMSRRDAAVEKARTRDVPSTGAKNSTLLHTQTDDREDAVYNGRPIQLTAPPLSIYHPVFATFKQQIAEPTDRATFTTTELRNAHQLIIDSVAFYADEKTRISKIQESLNVLVSPELFWNSEIPFGQRTFKPDGTMRCVCERFPARDTGAYEFTEVKNGVGEAHSDPIHQAQCDYVAYYSDKARNSIRNACCCPAFLVGIAGPYLMISGAVFTDRFVSQPFVEYMFLGGTPYLNDRIYDVAKILRVLKSCLLDLRRFYTELPPPSPPSPSTGRPISPSVFPHFRNFEVNGEQFEINYLARLAPQHSEKAVFKASIHHAGEERKIVVKFTPTYCVAAHEIAHKANCAPRLWFCGKVATVGGLFVVVMDFVEGQTLHAKSTVSVSQKIVAQLRQTLAVLHGQNYVYGDLRGPNVVVFLDKNGDEFVKLLDFDWGGEEGVVVYPADINMEIGWHAQVCPGGLIRREHDEFMLQRLGNGN